MMESRCHGGRDEVTPERFYSKLQCSVDPRTETNLSPVQAQYAIGCALWRTSS